VPTIHVDGRDYQAPEGKDLLSTLIALGIDVPYFCWHPALGSVGACRQCAVKVYRDDSDHRGRIEMACMTPVRDGMRVSVNDREAAAFRRRVIEWLMVNHPHDCPICDEGGECHLQDMTVMVGHVYRRFRGRKRTYRNQLLGPFINHEMNRCIQCFRCLRFYRDYAGGRDFDVFASKDHTYFGRAERDVGAHRSPRAQPRGCAPSQEDVPAPRLESEFSGNLIEVCPTGVFTDKTLKAHYTRKWDLETAPSVCVHCGLGCNTIPGARCQLLRRIHSRFNPEVNRDFICDRGRFGYEFVNHPQRLRQPTVGAHRCSPVEGDPPVGAHGRAPLHWDEAIVRFADGMRGCLPAVASAKAGRRVIGIGSPRASLESNFALRALVGEDAFCSGMAGDEHQGMARAAEALREGPARSARLAEVENADAVLLLGSDPTNEAPMLDYAIRQGMFRAAFDISRKLDIPDWNDYPVREAVQGARGKLFIAAPAAMKLDSLATEIVRCPPPDIISLAWAVAEALRAGADSTDSPAGRIAAGLAAARSPLVVASASWGPQFVDAAVAVTRALASRRGEPPLIFLLAPECNSMGAALMGGRSLEEALQEIEAGEADGLVVLENDLFRRAPAHRLEAALRRLRFLVVIDHLPTRTVEQADLVLPSPTFAESMGTLVNNEGRAQRFYQVFVAPGEARAPWQVLGQVRRRVAQAFACTPEAEASGTRLSPEDEPWQTCEHVTAALGDAIPVLAGALQASPRASWRDGVGAKIARESHRDSGRTANTADASVFEPPPPRDADSPFAFSMEGAQLGMPPALTPRYWRPGWNSVQARFLADAEFRENGASGMGKRLLEPDPAVCRAGMSSSACPPLALGANELWLTPRAASFGSDELSRMAPAIASVIPPPAVRINPAEAASRSLANGDMARVEVGGEPFGRSLGPRSLGEGGLLLPCMLDEDVVPGVAIIPLGYPETPGLTSPVRARMERAT
jgi:NADH-quinone oxidoreductase subunit G